MLKTRIVSRCLWMLSLHPVLIVFWRFELGFYMGNARGVGETDYCSIPS